MEPLFPASAQAVTSRTRIAVPVLVSVSSRIFGESGSDLWQRHVLVDGMENEERPALHARTAEAEEPDLEDGKAAVSSQSSEGSFSRAH